MQNVQVSVKNYSAYQEPGRSQNEWKKKTIIQGCLQEDSYFDHLTKIFNLILKTLTSHYGQTWNKEKKKIEVFSKYIASLSKEMEVIEYQTEILELKSSTEALKKSVNESIAEWREERKESQNDRITEIM